MSEETLVVSKPAWASKGIIGSVVVMLVSALALLKPFIPGLRDLQVDAAALTSNIVEALTLVFGALALWGRVKAKAPVHFVNRKTIPGGPFNPDAPVKKAIPVRRPRGYVLPDYLAWICWLAIAALVIAFLSFVRPARAQAMPERFPNVIEELEKPLPQNFSGAWLRVVPVEDKRPFFVRLVDSVSGSSAFALHRDPATGALSVAVTKLQLTGGADF